VEGASWGGSTTLTQVQVTILTPESNSGPNRFLLCNPLHLG
jgi:hypothetical protein